MPVVISGNVPHVALPIFRKVPISRPPLLSKKMDTANAEDTYWFVLPNLRFVRTSGIKFRHFETDVILPCKVPPQKS